MIAEWVTLYQDSGRPPGLVGVLAESSPGQLYWIRIVNIAEDGDDLLIRIRKSELRPTIVHKGD